MWASRKYTGLLAIAAAILFGSFWFADAACTPLGTVTTNFGLCKPAVGETGWGTVVNANMDTIDGNLTNALPRSYLAGLQLSNTVSATPTQVSVAAGIAQDAGQAGAMSIAATLSKDLSATWAVGSGNGGLCGSCSYSASTWYHVFVIKRTDTAVVDAYFDTSISAANIPAPYTLFRRIGSVKTDASKNILQFTQDGDYVRWKASVLDFNVTNPGTAATTASLPSVPPGVNVQAIVTANVTLGAAALSFLISDLSANDEAPVPVGTTTPAAPGASMGGTVGSNNISSFLQIRTSTAQQVRVRLSASDANTKLYLVTMGWWDTRGKML